MKKHIIAGLALLAVPLALSVLHAAADPAKLKLMIQADLVYKGAFRLPNGTIGSSTFNFGGGAMAYNPARDSLFIVGRNNDATKSTGQQIAEMSIPAAVNSTSLSNLSTASVLQPFMEPTEGKFLMAAVPTTPKWIGGLLVWGDRLIFTEWAYYDADNEQTLSHFARPLDLSAAGRVQGPYAVSAPSTGLPVQFSSLKAGFFSGYLARIPSLWQALLGGTAITGQCCVNISSRTSNGPGSFVFNADDIGAKSPVPASPLEYYTQLNPLGVWNTANGFYNGTTNMAGAIFPEQTRTLLFIGTHGTGPWCYGEVTSNGGPCYDPAAGSKGGHAYPYVHQIWAYDANDFVAVRDGRKAPWDVKPYSTWRFELPTDRKDGHRIGGAAYDPNTGRIFMSQWKGDGDLPLMHVFAIEFCAMCPRETKVTR